MRQCGQEMLQCWRCASKVVTYFISTVDASNCIRKQHCDHVLGTNRAFEHFLIFSEVDVLPECSHTRVTPLHGYSHTRHCHIERLMHWTIPTSRKWHQDTRREEVPRIGIHCHRDFAGCILDNGQLMKDMWERAFIDV